MLITDKALALWQSNKMMPPKVPIIYYDDRYMAVIDDEGPFIRFVDKNGHVYMASSKDCPIEQTEDKQTVYFCQQIDPILTTSKIQSDRDVFAMYDINQIL